MKQTKPFGRAHIPLSEPGQTTAKSADEPASKKHSDETESGSQRVDIFDLASRIEPLETTRTVPNVWGKVLRDGAIYLGMLVTLFVVYVGMRDSMILAKVLDAIPTDDTVMLCKDGTVIYDDDGNIVSMISNRLFNRGHLICTDWRVQKGFLYAPRG
ncbi:MAG: hypothetical protein KBF66_00945 [Rhodoferax sp.]|uniref:hypothetical protein n=1 Tax=Rhodoferax sp. TaxID=50421 RepID=UPI001B64CC8F|nr:hypothetical protein [Rhodoferax sp.]MBP9904093.1 hypothetical protein [Rhodoferax sp.]